MGRTLCEFPTGLEHPFVDIFMLQKIKYMHDIKALSLVLGEGETPSACRNLFPYNEICTPIGGGRDGVKGSFLGYVCKNGPASVNIYTNGCNCNRYCTLSTISGARVDNMCIINVIAHNVRFYFLTLDTGFIDPLIDFLSKSRKTESFYC